MREIKFRAWGKAGKGERFNMWSDVSIDSSIIGIRPYIGDQSFLLEATIMQYTGLKDKNGKEIYEGDYFVCHDYPFYNDELRNYIGEIYWDDLNLQWAWDIHAISDRVRGCACGGGMFDVIGRDIEIIGNIYENPELLNRGDE